MLDELILGHPQQLDDILGHLQHALDWMKSAQPRAIVPPSSPQPQLLFTDGAFELGKEGPLATCGAFLVDRVDNSRHLFGIKITGPLLEWLLKGGKQQIVTEIEILPVLIAYRHWAPGCPTGRLWFS